MPHAKIKTKQATFTLNQLHAELAGKIIDNRKEARRLRTAMKHVEAVLKLLEPEFNLRRIAVRRRRQNPWFKRGTVLRHAMDMMRRASTPLTTREITEGMLRARGVTDAKPRAIRDLMCSVLSSLQNYRGRGVAAHDQSNPVRWSIKSEGIGQLRDESAEARFA